MAISVENLSREILKEINKYTNGVSEKVEEIAKNKAKEGVKLLKSHSPVGVTAKYQTGWRATKLPSGAWVLHNARRPGLTQLLEKGHAKANGGRTRALTHIAPIEKWLVKSFVEEVEEAIKG